ncbi:MAG: o-succinylbenzoate synthase [Potamolinea sp.]
MTNYQFEFRPYRRPFVQVLSTNHGNWNIREGIILRLTDESGKIGWGEIAPISWFGSETLEEALNFCQQLSSQISQETIFSIPLELPACQFGFESALGMGNETFPQFHQNPKSTPPTPLIPPYQGGTKTTRGGQNPQSEIAYCYLLPTGEAALESWQTAWNQGYRTFKWKIGVSPIAEELTVFQKLTQALPASVKLRLDANGGLTQQSANQWLKVTDNLGIVEFLEQPLPPQQLNAMLEISNQYSTPIALDESVATLKQLETCYQQGWRGIFVIKAAIAGSPKRLREFCQQQEIDTVFSSVFETAIGRQAALQLASELSNPNRAVGFGVNHWFNEDEETWLKHLWKEH